MKSILEWLKRIFGKKLFNLEWLMGLFKRSLKFPVSFPTMGWEIIPTDEKIEEEQMPDFEEDCEFCMITIGDILLSRYQVVGKLGWGTTSTVWLVRDLQMNDYLTLKLFALNTCDKEESELYDRMKQGNQQHPGWARVRKKLGELTIPQKIGWREHLGILQAPLGESLLDIQNRSAGERLDKLTIQSAIYQMLLALDYLHTECKIINTDMTLDRYVQDEIESPTPRKTVSGYTVYRSRPLEPASQLGKIELGDFGSAEQGDIPHKGQLIQPPIYRAPEVILEKQWNYPVDIWNLGIWAWRAFEGSKLFTGTKGDDDDHISAYSTSAHLAQITGLLGPPPPGFIEPDTDSAKYFDQDGNWIDEDCEVHPTSFEDLEKHLEGKDKEMFLDLMKGMITWRPEDRKTARELIEHPWLQGVFSPPGCYKPVEESLQGSR
ncbi:uncharacterized protein N7500_008828 [Penicillium coprophilum]|uniref:uncharacterized protein n=1 Tax=Penicillium coprophilum TaxID=36646 RepID=UPI00239FA678|nr:uncharacterized protein N7500_008828 [Penicillium coprophilum]KAJ5159177.1 hypothetical protein N7500_008828 [Penicillium coprophilum]